MENARLLHFLLLSITILLLSCTKKGSDDVTPKDDSSQMPTIKLIDEGKYVNTKDPEKFFTVTPLTEDDKNNFTPGTYATGKYLSYDMYKNILFSEKINFYGMRKFTYTHFECLIYSSDLMYKEYAETFYIYTKYYTEGPGVVIRANPDKTFDVGTLKYTPDSTVPKGYKYVFTPYEFDFVKQ